MTKYRFIPFEDEHNTALEMVEHRVEELLETKVFTYSSGCLPHVQFIVNSFANGYSTVKMMMPQFPGEHSFYWLSEKYGQERVHQIRQEIHDYLRAKKSDIAYWGF